MSRPGRGSYIELYYGLVASQRQGVEWLGILLAPLLFALLLGAPLWAFMADARVDRLAKIAAVVVFLTAVGIGIYFALLVFLVLSFTRSPARAAHEVAARLLFSTRPYRGDRGLNLDDIYRLKRIAEIEQGSADWRGSFLNFVVVGLIVLVAMALPSLQSFLAASAKPAASLPWAGLRGIETAPAGIIALAFAGVVALWLAGHWVRYLKNFIASEYANRVILMACEEIIALFEILGIAPARQLAFYERRAIIERFGCRLAPAGGAGFNSRHRVKSFEVRMNGKYYGSWFLLT